MALQAQPERKGERPTRVPDEKQVEEMVSRLATDLKLSEAQQTKVLELYKAHFKVVMEAMSQEKTDREANREAMETMREKFEKLVKAELTEEQAKVFDKIQAQHGPGNRPEPPVREKE